MVKQRKGGKIGAPKKKGSGLPAPFKAPPDVLQPLIDTLDLRHVYILHVDNKPADLKRKVFIVPVLMNVAILLLFIWRMYAILPWYLRVLTSTLGYANETTLVAAEMEWETLLPEVGKRSGQFMLDLMLYVFVWPWPYEFFLGLEHANPVAWRRNVGFRDREIVARRSRAWDKALKDVINDKNSKDIFMNMVGIATSPNITRDRTGYLLMNKEWNLDWATMIDATTMVDKKMAAIEAFKLVVLVYQEEYGWIVVDHKLDEDPAEDERRTQILLFRDALSAIGKEDLFFRWIEVVQFEANQPGGFTAERQGVVAQQVRDLFQKEGVDFDQLWKDSVGTDGIAI
ncbi:hypothetical protein BKA67DRAFT_542669 [Truncatella angustata]|uniref:Uncharacterized protein n=1 Tax=Truncatella angustata TaxID=152316 RepID=A0A9P8REB9_9PEZI|nr:uncharacterized protein BKA67DRAFT_542669 [Truncatella angustata]KAH6638564.1 hypothetical protein BKA67DRAFT_542669 [Truncatella angustata]KAH8199788.1 hypothetical protein TruAng_006069 [Truncatella angustata]